MAVPIASKESMMLESTYEKGNDMSSTTASKQLKTYLVSQDIVLTRGVSDERIKQFESYYRVQMPVDLANYFREVNGSGEVYAFGMLRFWNLEEVATLKEVVERTPRQAAVIQADYSIEPGSASDLFVFADYLHESQLYAIHLADLEAQRNYVVLLDGTQPIRVADSFSDFIDLYIHSPERLRLSAD
jgi:hypothetical protein